MLHFNEEWVYADFLGRCNVHFPPLRFFNWGVFFIQHEIEDVKGNMLNMDGENGEDFK